MAGSSQPDRYVVVAMDDPAIGTWLPYEFEGATVLEAAPSPDGLPLAAARNLGVEHAVACGDDVVVLLDVDCLAGQDLVAGYAAAVASYPEIIWSGPVTYLPPPPPEGYDLASLPGADHPHPARPAPPPGVLDLSVDPRLFWSLSFALHTRTWGVVGGFCEEYVGYGGEDTDFARLAGVAGTALGWTGSARAYHQHHPTSAPPVQHLDSILRNGRLFRARWGEWPMMGWLREFEQLGLVAQRADDWVRVEEHTDA